MTVLQTIPESAEFDLKRAHEHLAEAGRHLANARAILRALGRADGYTGDEDVRHPLFAWASDLDRTTHTINDVLYGHLVPERAALRERIEP